MQVCLKMLFPVTYSSWFPERLLVLLVHLLWYVYFFFFYHTYKTNLSYSALMLEEYYRWNIGEFKDFVIQGVVNTILAFPVNNLLTISVVGRGIWN